MKKEQFHIIRADKAGVFLCKIASIKTIQVKKNLFYIGVLSLLITAVFSSCVSQKSGCYMSKGFSGTH